MKSYDNTIKYYELLMYYKDTAIYKKYSLPDGFHFEFYKDGNMNDWINIHIESGEFCAIEEGIMIFHDFYDTFIQELNKRCIFIVDDKTNEKVGTATVSLLSKEEFGYNGAVDWVAIKKDYQGKGLARPLITKILEIANELEHKGIILHTQTTTWLAAKSYLDFGFNILNKNEKNGWKIKIVRMVLDILMVVIGVLLGGKFGICTVATVLLSGPVIQATVNTVKKSKIFKILRRA